MPEFRIDFSIMKRDRGQDDFSEYAFGSTWAENSIYEAAHMALSQLQNEEYDVIEEENN